MENTDSTLAEGSLVTAIWRLELARARHVLRAYLRTRHARLTWAACKGKAPRMQHQQLASGTAAAKAKSSLPCPEPVIFMCGADGAQNLQRRVCICAHCQQAALSSCCAGCRNWRSM